jgi:hypothetical protein
MDSNCRKLFFEKDVYSDDFLMKKYMFVNSTFFHSSLSDPKLENHEDSIINRGNISTPPKFPCLFISLIPYLFSISHISETYLLLFSLFLNQINPLISITLEFINENMFFLNHCDHWFKEFLTSISQIDLSKFKNLKFIFNFFKGSGNELSSTTKYLYSSLNVSALVGIISLLFHYLHNFHNLYNFPKFKFEELISAIPENSSFNFLLSPFFCSLIKDTHLFFVNTISKCKISFFLHDDLFCSTVSLISLIFNETSESIRSTSERYKITAEISKKKVIIPIPSSKTELKSPPPSIPISTNDDGFNTLSKKIVTAEVYQIMPIVSSQSHYDSQKSVKNSSNCFSYSLSFSHPIIPSINYLDCGGFKILFFLLYFGFYYRFV